MGLNPEVSRDGGLASDVALVVVTHVFVSAVTRG